MELNKIYQGDALEVLKTFPDESIDMVITSPPYWALRDYGSSVETIWDGKDNCKHRWNKVDVLRKATPGDKPSKKSKVAIHRTNAENRPGKPSNFCSKCGAWKGQLGLEPTFGLYIKHLCNIFDEVKRVLKKEGTCWVNMGDSYAGNMGKKSGWTDNKLGFSKDEAITKGVCLTKKTKIIHQLPQKCLVQIPSRFAIEMTNRGWILRNEIIWYKPNCMPSSAKDRFTIDFEKIFFFSKNKKYYFETQFEKYTTPMNRWGGEELKADGKSTWDKGTGQDTYRERNMRPNSDGRNKRCIWKICSKPFPFKKTHFAVYPEELCQTPIKAGCPEKGIVLDPFMGAGTTAVVAKKLNRNYIGIELNSSYIDIANRRLAQKQLL